MLRVQRPGSPVLHVVLFTNRARFAEAITSGVFPPGRVRIGKGVVRELELAAAAGLAVLVDPHFIDGKLAWRLLQRIVGSGITSPGGSA